MVSIAAEDILGLSALRKIIETETSLSIENEINAQGSLNLKKRVRTYNQAAAYSPFIVITDLDKKQCPKKVLEQWLAGITVNDNFIFRICVQEIETWMIADRDNFSRYFKIPLARIPTSVERINDPKEFILELVRKNSPLSIREMVLPAKNSNGKTGRLYNTVFQIYISEHWYITAAQASSTSLKRAVSRIREMGDRVSPRRTILT